MDAVHSEFTRFQNAVKMYRAHEKAIHMFSTHEAGGCF